MSTDARFREIAGGDTSGGEPSRRLFQPVLIRVSDHAPWARQVTAICLADLLSRLLPRLTFEAGDTPAAEGLPPGPRTLLERMQQAQGHALIDPEAPGDDEITLTVVVGPDAAGDIFIDADGWLSYLGEHQGALAAADRTNPIGPLVAACRGASQVIQQLLGDLLPATSHVPDSYWSALTLGPVEGPEAENPRLANPNIDALLMGVGSIGGATDYAFARVPGLTGTLAITDPERLEDRNSRKALLARRADIESGARKIDVATAELAHLSLEVDPVEGSLAQYVADHPREHPLPLVICAVDSIPARCELADHMPLEAINGACGDTHIVVSGHVTGDGPCVYCLYIGEVLDTDTTRAKMIHRETGLAPGTIDQWRILRVRLDTPALAFIARFRGMPPGSLDHRAGLTLDELFEAEFLYGEVQLRSDNDTRSTLQLAFVPALAGILLAAEALKAGTPELGPYRLGARGSLGDNGTGVEYCESLLDPPVGMITTPRRWSDNACLCRSLRRLAMMRERYGLDG